MRGVSVVLLHPRRVLTLLGALIAAVAYVWAAAVRAVPAVRRRKAARRAVWQARDRSRWSG